MNAVIQGRKREKKKKKKGWKGFAKAMKVGRRKSGVCGNK